MRWIYASNGTGALGGSTLRVVALGGGDNGGGAEVVVPRWYSALYRQDVDVRCIGVVITH
jgi:hypothetical protein